MDDEKVRFYRPKFKRWIESSKWDCIAEKISENCMDIITQVMNAEKDGDCSWIIWENCDYVLERIRKISRQLKFQGDGGGS